MNTLLQRFLSLSLCLAAMTSAARLAGQDIDPNTNGANCSNTTSGVTCVATYHNDGYRDGVNSNETALKPSLFTVPQTSSNFGLLGTNAMTSTTIDGLIYAQPLFLSGVSMASSSQKLSHKTKLVNRAAAADQQNQQLRPVNQDRHLFVRQLLRTEN
jgi:hypothetical protein